jgi:hypothetical protein
MVEEAIRQYIGVHKGHAFPMASITGARSAHSNADGKQCLLAALSGTQRAQAAIYQPCAAIC